MFYDVTIPVYDGRRAKFSGLCLDTITGPMPFYPVGEASVHVVNSYIAQGGNRSDLPSVPAVAGGDTDFLIGILYNYFQPRLIHIMPSGLGIYRSMFVGVDGTRGCVGGPSELFEACEKQFMDANNYINFRTFLANQLQLFRTGTKICLDYDMLGCSEGHHSVDRCRNDTMVMHISGDQKVVNDSSVHVCNLAIHDEDNPDIEPVIPKLSASNDMSIVDGDKPGNCTSCKTVVLKMSNIKECS